MVADQAGEQGYHPRGGQGKIDFDAEYLPVPFLDHVQGAEAAAIRQRIAPKVERPADVGLDGCLQRPFDACRQTLLFASLAHL